MDAQSAYLFIVAALIVSAGAVAALFAWTRLRSARKTLENERQRSLELGEELREKEYYLRTIILSEPECVKLHKADGTVLDINPAGATLIEADSPKELLGSCIYSYIDPEDLPSYQALTEHVFQGSSETLEFRIRGLRGTTRWMETRATPMRDRDNNIIALLGITRDITDKKRAEEADIQVRRRQDQLTRLCRVLSAGEMASALGHELNQPLCAIMSYAETIEELVNTEAPDMERLRNYSRRMSQETERAGATVRRIRDYVSKRQPITAPTDINSLVRDVVTFLQPEARRHQTSINYQLSSDACTVQADSVQIQQVLVNLITNGLDALNDSKGEGNELQVDCNRTDDRIVAVSVRDNGRGLNGANPEKIFDPFYTTKDGGVGIGLSISRSIAESHGGSIKLLPNADQGMTAVLCLPAAAEAGGD